MNKNLLIVLFFFIFLSFSLTHKCIHDEFVKNPNNFPTLSANTKQTYKILKKRDGNVIYENFRITPYYTRLEADLASNQALLTYLKTKIMPYVLDYFKNTLTVIPVTGNLRFNRRCTSYWNPSGKCAGFDTAPRCDTMDIPSSHLNNQTYYPISSSASELLIGGEGIPNSDFIIYLTARQTSCSNGVIAYASTCSRDQNDRPIAGIVNFCTLSTTDDIQTFEKNTKVVIHEMTHALGFSISSYAFFRDSNGNPRTARDYKGLPPFVNGEYVANITTVANVTVREKKTFEIRTPKVVEVAREHFGCNTLTGLELEEYGGTGTAKSHWEMRLISNEYMAGSVSLNMILSKLTLALLEDSGWYKPNYDNAEYLAFGNNKGCDFVNKKCIDSSKKSIDKHHFCTTANEAMCTTDRVSRGSCSFYNYSSIPSEFNYFGSTIGGNGLYDYCPIYLPSNNQDCRLASNSPKINAYGEKYSVNSKCVENTLFSSYLRLIYVDNGKERGACFERYCIKETDGSKTAMIRVGFAYIQCKASEKGQKKTLPLLYIGSLTCPDTNILCPDNDKNAFKQPCTNDCRLGTWCPHNLFFCYYGSCVNGKCVLGLYTASGNSSFSSKTIFIAILAFAFCILKLVL